MWTTEIKERWNGSSGALYRLRKPVLRSVYYDYIWGREMISDDS